MNDYRYLLSSLPANTADILRLATEYPFPGLADALFMLEKRRGPFDLRSVLLARQLLNPQGFTYPSDDRKNGSWSVGFTPTFFECYLRIHDGEVAIKFNEAYEPTDTGSGALIRDNGSITIRGSNFDRVISIKRGCCQDEEFCPLDRRDDWGVTELDKPGFDVSHVIDRIQMVNAAFGGELKIGLLSHCRDLKEAGFVGNHLTLSTEYTHSHEVLKRL